MAEALEWQQQRQLGRQDKLQWCRSSQTFGALSRVRVEQAEVGLQTQQGVACFLTAKQGMARQFQSEQEQGDN